MSFQKVIYGFFTFVLILAVIASYHQGLVNGIRNEDSKLEHTHNMYNELAQKTPCGNVSKHITNISFMHDYYELIDKTYSCHYSGKDYGILYNLDDIETCDNKNIDCEDISFMINCIAKEYDVNCSYYTYQAIGRENHRGIFCNVSGEKIEMY